MHHFKALTEYTRHNLSSNSRPKGAKFAICNQAFSESILDSDSELLGLGLAVGCLLMGAGLAVAL